jgi:hypothetical protein
MSHDCSYIAPAKLQNHPKWPNDIPRLSRGAFILGCLNHSLVLPSFRLRVAFALPSLRLFALLLLCLCFDLASLSFFLCFAFASPFLEGVKDLAKTFKHGAPPGESADVCGVRLLVMLS